ncbi:threonine/serine exporter family protein [Granulosicoccus antarcticus]|uniref:threonine/serine exporter family protein n=1 Tax=Granulosicoccus antarcticus TaxID=437505 RepID=UPI00197AF6FA|nr:threonine/serine exporter family protein [Granulosicoccus antarcticus]
MNVVVQASPTAINYQFPDFDHKVVIKQLEPASIDLSLLANTIIGINENSSSPVPPSTRYRPWLMMISNMLIPPAFLVLVGSTMNAIAMAFILGFLVWVCQYLCRDEHKIVVEFLSALVTGLMVSFISSQGIDVPIWALSIAAIVLFVPGLSIANSLECLAFNDLISGTCLFAQSIFILVKLFIGIYIGLTLGDTLWGASISQTNLNEVASWMPFVALPALSLSLGINFNARFIDIFYALPVSILGMWGPLYLDLGSGWIVGTWVTTVVITLYGTWLAKTLKLTGAIYIVQGIIILVPGSRVLVGASESFLHQPILSTPDIGLSALLMFSAIVTGQITAYSVYSQKNRYLIN